MTPEHQEAYDLVGQLIADSRRKGHHVDLHDSDWNTAILNAQRLICEVRTPSAQTTTGRLRRTFTIWRIAIHREKAA